MKRGLFHYSLCKSLGKRLGVGESAGGNEWCYELVEIMIEV